MISVVIITKDSAQRIGTCLELLKDVPEVIVADTGSSDNTPQIAKSLGAKVCDIPWTNNFSAARTLAQQQAKYDLVMRLDDDELLQGSEGIHEVLDLAKSAPDGICMRRTQPTGESDMLLRVYSRKAWRWDYPVHEILRSKSGLRLRVVDAQVTWVEHRPSIRNRNYANLLLAHMSRYMHDPYMCYMCLKELVQELRWEEAFEAFQRYDHTSGGYHWHRSQAQIYFAEILRNTGRSKEALAVLTGPGLASSRAEALHLAAEIARELKIGDEYVRKLYQQAAELPLPREIGMSGNSQIPYVVDISKYGRDA